LPSRTAFGTVRNKASRIGAPANAVEATVDDALDECRAFDEAHHDRHPDDRPGPTVDDPTI
jgi:hypothetical protein